MTIESITLQQFIEHVLDERLSPECTMLHIEDGFVVEWNRPLYSGDRVGMDHFEILHNGQVIGEAVMFGDIDDTEVERIASLVAPGKAAEEIVGKALYGHRQNDQGNPLREAIYRFYRELGRPPEEIEVTGIVHGSTGIPSQEDLFPITIDVFALRQIKHYESGQEPPPAAFFEEQARLLLALLTDESALSEAACRAIGEALASKWPPFLARTRSLPVPERARQLADLLLVILRQHGMTSTTLQEERYSGD